MPTIEDCGRHLPQLPQDEISALGRQQSAIRTNDGRHSCNNEGERPHVPRYFELPKESRHRSCQGKVHLHSPKHEREKGGSAARAQCFSIGPSSRRMDLEARFSRSQPNPRILTSKLKNSQQPGVLLKLHEEYGSYFNSVHLSAMWSRLKRETTWIQSNRGLLLPLQRTTLGILRANVSGAREIANIAHGLAKSKVGIDPPWNQLWEELASAAYVCVAELDPQNIANVAWAFATAKYPVPRLFDALAREAATRVRVFNSQDIANTAWAFATVGHPAPVLFNAISEQVATLVSAFNPQAIANTIWAFATMGHTVPALFDALAQEVASRPESFKPQAMSIIAWAFATAEYKSPALFDALAREVAARAGTFNPQEIANTAWAFATARHTAPAVLFDALARRATTRANAFKPQEVANTAWAFATVGYPSPALFDALVGTAVTRASSFQPQNIANTVWAYATADHAAPILFDTLAAEAATRVAAFKPQEIANTAWAFATAGHAAPALFLAIAEEVVTRVGTLKTQNLVNIAWAFATAGHDAPTLFEAFADEATPRAGTLSTQGIANSAWAFATARYSAPALFDALAVEVISRAGAFKSQGIANTSWAFATVGHAAPAMFNALAAETATRVDRFKPQEIANTLWAFSVVAYTGHHHKTLESAAFRHVTIHLETRICSFGFSTEMKIQFYQWYLWHCERGGLAALPSPLVCRFRAAFQAMPVQSSRLQSDVCFVLRDLLRDQGAVREEVTTKEGYTLDIVVRWKHHDVGLEVDGPYHFLRRSQRPTGATLLKRRQLRSFGWKLASVPYWEWNVVRPQTHPGFAHANTQGLGAAREYLRRALDVACEVSVYCIRLIEGE